MPKHTLKQLQEEVDKVFLLKDPYIVEVTCASIIAHFLSSDPCWIVIVAPSGGAKSEFVNLVSSIKWTPKPPPGEKEHTHCVYPLSTLSSKTFISGQKSTSKDTSLLLQIKSGIITFKDLTSLLSEQQDERRLIMAQLREIWDGKYAKSFGTGETLAWKGKITILAASTYAIHSMKQAYSAMGERFLFYNMTQPERFDAGLRTMENQEEGKMTEHREFLTGRTEAYVLDVLNNMPLELVKIDKELQKEMLLLAELATRARSSVQRNWASREQEITEVDPPEMPTRFAGALQTMARALMVIAYHETGKMELMPHHKNIFSKLALDSVTRTRRIAMLELSRYDVLQTAGLAIKLGMPTNSVRRWLEDLTALEVVDREKGGGSKGDRWRIKPNYRDIIMKYEGIQREGAELTEDSAQPIAEEDGLTALLREEEEEAQSGIF